MSNRKLHSRSQSIDSRAGSVQGNLDENSLTDFSQEGGIMTGKIRDSEVITSNPNLESTSDDGAINSDEKPNNISRDQLQDFVNTVMQAITAESAKQTAAIQEAIKTESIKKTAALLEESKKTTLLRMKLKNKQPR
jgi:predicted transcriptional regulator